MSLKAITPELLRQYRGQLNYTQMQMAKALGMSRRAYIDIETGNSPIRQIHTAAIYFTMLLNIVNGGSCETITTVLHKVIPHIQENKHLSSTVKLINLDTGETIDADPDSLRDRGLPEDYEVAENITTDRWIELYQTALEGSEKFYR